MRTLPVNPLAGVAAQEVRIEDANAWRHLRPGQFQADLVQRQVAMQAQAEWPRTTRQIEALVQFAQLQRRFQGMHITAVADDSSLEQFAVAGQHDASLLRSDLGDLAILEAIVVEGVEAAHAQQAGQPAKVRISDETQHP
ncbi:hypothetical protein D3C81_981250 [compost metagenome]